jgi:carbon storage regulator
MLVLSRRVGEEIVIAGKIRLTVVAIKGTQVRLGITAPLAVPVSRQELLVGRAKNVASPTAANNGENLHDAPPGQPP